VNLVFNAETGHTFSDWDSAYSGASILLLIIAGCIGLTSLTCILCGHKTSNFGRQPYASLYDSGPSGHVSTNGPPPTYGEPTPYGEGVTYGPPPPGLYGAPPPGLYGAPPPGYTVPPGIYYQQAPNNNNVTPV